MKRSKEEAEVIVRLDYLDKKAHICVSQWPKMAAKMKKLYGKSLDGDNPRFSARWEVPLKLITFRSMKPRKAPRRPFPAQRRAVEQHSSLPNPEATV